MLMAREHPRGAFGLAQSTPAEATDELPLDQFFRRYSAYVAKIGYRLLGRDDEVDDLVQDVFLAAHRGARKLRDPEAIRGWLATVAVRTARRRLRARRVKVMLRFDASPDYEDVADPSASPEQRAMLAAVYRILDTLPAKERIPWSLRYVEGEQLERIAELCGCSLATVKRRIKAAHEVIRRGVDHG
jgi:RNA polymerase sigma-70 factor (ECF subfamily)